MLIVQIESDDDVIHTGWMRDDEAVDFATKIEERAFAREKWSRITLIPPVDCTQRPWTFKAFINEMLHDWLPSLDFEAGFLGVSEEGF